MPEIANALSIDVEDYFQVSALAPYIARSDWDRLPCRIERNVERLLELLAESGSQATFFTLGWIAERYPGLVRRLVACGHELASHGYAHQRATDQTPAQFLDDIGRSKSMLEGIAGVEVKGYRAPSFSIGPSTRWAFGCVAKAGYRYSSNVYPIHHDHYGMPDAPRFAYSAYDGLLEVPITTARLLNRNVPAGGGGYFRLLPYAVSRALIRRVNGHERRAAVFYLHPWELDADQPRVRCTTLKTCVRHCLNLHRTEPRLRRLLGDFVWRRMDEIFLGQTISNKALSLPPEMGGEYAGSLSGPRITREPSAGQGRKRKSGPAELPSANAERPRTSTSLGSSLSARTDGLPSSATDDRPRR